MKIRGNPIGVNRQRKLKRAAERAVPALHAVVLLAGRLALGAHARQRQSSVEHLNLKVLALEARQLRGDRVLVGGLVEVDGRHPSRGAGREPVEPLLNGQQVADRIPSGKRHGLMLTQRLRAIC